MLFRSIATLPANLAGIPGLVLPCGISTIEEKPLPVGLQLLAGQLKDAVLIKTAFALEQVLPPATYESPVLKAAI